MADDKPDWQQIESLGKITCSSHACDQGLHSFRKGHPREGESYHSDVCVSCGASPVDFERVRSMDLTEVANTEEALKFELIRYAFWIKPLDRRAINYAKRKGSIGLTAASENRIRSLTPPSRELFRDGFQTPLHGNPIYYAQHATATCCRKCLDEWYGIDRHRQLSGDEVGFMTGMVTYYVDKRLPDLALEGIRVPPIRKNGGSFGERV